MRSAFPSPEEFLRLRNEYRVTSADLHLQSLVFYGVASSAFQSPYCDDLKRGEHRRYRRLFFAHDRYRFHTRLVERDSTPYLLDRGTLSFHGDALRDFNFVELPGEDFGSEKNWYFKHDDRAENPFWELRLNPINGCAQLKHRTGAQGEFRGCAFCHRMYDAPRIGETRRTVSLQEVFRQIEAAHGVDAFRRVEKVLLVTGNAKDAARLLELAEEAHGKWLSPRGFTGTFSVVTSQIEEEPDIDRLARIDNRIFDFTLECFSRRRLILGAGKGKSIDRVRDILRKARNRFTNIRVNYLVGLDSMDVLRSGFGELRAAGLVDDVIATTMTPFSQEMTRLRTSECDSVEFILKARMAFREMGLWTRRAGVEKTIFEFDRMESHQQRDLLLPAPSHSGF